MKKIADIGGSVETLDANTRVHMTADIEHSDMFSPIYERHIHDEATARAVVGAARDSLRVDRAFRGALASAMMEVSESRAAS